MAEGYIYILLNRAFQNDHYKIGMTTKKPEERAQDLSGATGVPRAFEVLYEQKVIDYHHIRACCGKASIVSTLLPRYAIVLSVIHDWLASLTHDGG